MLKLLLTTLLLFGPSICLGRSRYGRWSYKKGSPNGPRSWGRIKGGANCLGSNQSPIDINTLETTEKQFKRLRLRNFMSNGHSGNARPVEMSNNGKTVKITLEGDYFTDGGGLPSVYRAAQIHFHWGADWTRGSEHTFNGQSYPGEMHIVHYDTVRYATIGDAMRQPKGLATLGFFIKLGRHNAAWDPIINRLRDIRYTGRRVDYTQEPFQLGSLIPMDRQSLMKFYRYQGSMTQPGCYESVIWTVFHDPIEVSESQLDQFGTLTRLSQAPTGPARPSAEPDDDLIVDNYRPVQPRNYRRVYQSFGTTDSGGPDYESQQAFGGTGGFRFGGAGGFGGAARGNGGTVPNFGDAAGGTDGQGAGGPQYGQIGGIGGVVGDFPTYGGDYDTGADTGGGQAAGGTGGGAFPNYGSIGGGVRGGDFPSYGGIGGDTGSNSNSSGGTGQYSPNHPQIQNYDTNYFGNNYFGGADGNNDYDEFDDNDFYQVPPRLPGRSNPGSNVAGQTTGQNQHFNLVSSAIVSSISVSSSLICLSLILSMQRFVLYSF